MAKGLHQGHLVENGNGCSRLPLFESTVHLFTQLLNKKTLPVQVGVGSLTTFRDGVLRCWSVFWSTCVHQPQAKEPATGLINTFEYTKYQNLFNQSGSRESKARSCILGNTTTTAPHTFCQETSTVSILVCMSLRIRDCMGREGSLSDVLSGS